MVQYICDNPQVENEFKALCQQITAGGGFVHDDLIIEQKDRHIAIRAPAHIAPDAVVLKVHKACLLPRSNFEVEIIDDRFELSDCSASATAEQKALMETMLAIYNLTDKVGEHRDISILQLVHKDMNVIKWLLEARDTSSFKLVDELAKKSAAQALVDGFFKTRYLGVNFGEGDRQRVEHCLMPMIDFLDHNTLAAPYNLPAGEDVCLSTQKSTVMPHSDVSYVCYGILDAFDTLLNYNFVDETAVFVRSIPLHISLEGVGSVVVKSIVGKANHNTDLLPPALQGLGMYLPSMAVNAEHKRLELGYLMIPQQGAPRSMRRILAAGVSMMLPDASQPEVMGHVQALEKEIIRHNIIFYSSLERKLANHNIDQDFKTIYDNIGLMIRTQLDNINKYPFIEQANA